MRKFLFILGIIFSIVIMIISIYVLFKINFVVSSVNGQLYDGFGSPYRNGKPYSPYTIAGIVGFFGGAYLLKICYVKFALIGDKSKKEG